MACIDVTVRQITSGITVSVEVISYPSRKEDILPRNQLCVLAEIVTSNLTVIASAVCTVNTGGGGEETVLYLEIEPEILWVYPDFERENYVYSNTDWYID